MSYRRINQRVKIHPDCENENYTKYRGQILRIYTISKNEQEHPGYDNSMYPDRLYDLKTESGEDVPFSLYDYELINV